MKILRLLSTLLILSVFVLQSCEEKETPESASITFAEGVITAPSFLLDGGTVPIKFSSTQAWTVDVEADKTWCTVSAASGEAGAAITLTITVAKNETYDVRTAKVSIISGEAKKEIIVTQGQVGVLTPVSEATFRVSATSGTFEVKHNTSIEDLVVVSKPDWVTEVATRAAVDRIHKFTATDIPDTEYGRYGVITFKSAAFDKTISYTVYQGNIVNNTANATDRTVNTLASEIIAELGANPISRIKVIGTINEADFATLKPMTYIDLSEASVVGKIVLMPDDVPYPYLEVDGNAIPMMAFATEGTSGRNEDGRGIPTQDNMLKEFKFPKGITHIGYAAFMFTTNLTGTLSLPSQLTYIEFAAFGYSQISGDLVIPESIKVIRGMAFGACQKLTGTLIIPDNITELGEGAFASTGFTGTVIIPKSIAVIDDETFTGSHIDHIILHDGITAIKVSAFASTKLTEITVLATTPPTVASKADFQLSFAGIASVTINIPKGTTDAYRAAWTGAFDQGAILNFVEIK